ncbi:MAG: hypothetical protein WCC39_14845 [Telluria sp.]
MKSLIFGAALCAAAFPALAQTNVSISVGQPGFYGRVDLGDFAPRPVLYAAQPVIVRQSPYYAAEPIYLRVPYEHRRYWSRYCGRYDACGRPVLFVRDDWYTNTYVPRYREHFHGGRRPEVRVVERVEYRDHDRGRGGGRWEDHGRGHGGGERWEQHGRGHGEEHGRGHGEGHGEGHGNGHGNGRGHD